MTSPLDGLNAEPCPDASALETAGGTGELANPPGRSALAYRMDTRDGFFARLLARLTTETLPDGPAAGSRPLAGLEAGKAVDPAGKAADPTAALLDAWAVAGDILTFYQERIANEGFLRTAVERRSVLELGRLVGQGPGPGVAASALLAFTVADAPGSPATVQVPRGTQVQSIPGQGALPQTFETVEDLVARAELNVLVPRRSRPQELDGARELYLAGTGLRLSAGDTLLLVTPETHATWTGRATAVDPDAGRGITRVRLETPVGLAGADADAADVFVLRERASFFGHNAPRWGSLPKSDVVRNDPYAAAASNWDQGRTIWTDSQQVAYALAAEVPAVYLDRDVESAAAGTWAVFTGQALGTGAPLTAVYRITGRTAGSRADYAVQGPSTGLALTAAGGGALPALAARPAFDVRRATAYVGSERLERAELPIVAPLPDAAEDGGLATLTLDGGVSGLVPGRPVAVRGTTTAGDTVSRVLLLQQVDASDPAHTRLAFQQPLLPGADDPAVRFVRSTVTLYGNVALATHGGTVAEVLGSGDSSRTGQRFPLSRPPLTQLSAPLPGGRQSSLAVRVGNVLWQEVENLATEGPESRSYMVEIRDDGRTAVRFGDGVHGARLPTGRQNVTAVYRSGLGRAGMVDAGAIQLFLTRPLGIREVTNPLPATGGADPDGVEQERANAPVRSRTLGRIVSFSDFEDFARSFAGIAKAQAVPIAGIHLTVAGEQGAAVDSGSALHRNLLEALGAARLPGPPIALSSYQPVPFRVEARLILDPRYLADDVFTRVEQALLSAFSFDRRDLGQPLLASDVLRVIQGVPGVVAVDLEALYRAGAPVTLEPSLTALRARLAAGRVLPAQLLLLAAGGVLLRERKS